MNKQQPAWRKKNNKYNKKREPTQWDNNPTVQPLQVIVYNNDINQALRILKTKISNDGVLQEIKHKRYAEKPSDKKRRKHREALKKLRKATSKKPTQRRNSRSKVVASVPE